jgi:hypothetical protein
MPRLSSVCLALAVAVSLTSPLAAQELITTDRAASAPKPSTEPAPPIGYVRDHEDEIDRSNPCGPGPTPRKVQYDANGEPIPDRSIHGEVSAGIGTHGYREVAGSVCVPVSDKGFVALSVDQTQFDGRRR